MPRKAKARRTLGGDPAQPIDPVPGQTYGMGQEQMDLQRQMPAPNVQQPPPSRPPAPRPQTPAQAQQQPGAPVPAPGGELDIAALAQHLSGKLGLLEQPSERPNEPITAGLTRGPGPGPEALQVRSGSPTLQTLENLYQATGDDIFLRLAQGIRR